jgi:hypothetical protein
MTSPLIQARGLLTVWSLVNPLTRQSRPPFACVVERPRQRCSLACGIHTERKVMSLVVHTCSYVYGNRHLYSSWLVLLKLGAEAQYRYILHTGSFSSTTRAGDYREIII